MTRFEDGEEFYNNIYDDIIFKIKKAAQNSKNQTCKFRVSFLLKNYLTEVECDLLFKRPIYFEKLVNLEMEKEGWHSKSWITYGDRKRKQLYFKPHHYEKMGYKTKLYPSNNFFKYKRKCCFVDLRKNKK
jgi:hypothetical protein